MSSIDYTTTGLINLIQLNASIPNVQQRFSTDDLVAFINQELNNNLVPQIKSLNSELFVTYKDLQLVTGQANYELPYQAIGDGLRLVTQVFLGDTTKQTEYQIRRLTQEEISAYWNGLTLLPVANNQVYGYYIQGNEIVFYPAPTNPVPQIVRLRYFRQPNNLVAVNYAGQITSINTSTNTVTLNNVPINWDIGTSICVIQNLPSFNTLIEATPILNISTPSVQIADVTGLNVGDWVCLEGDSVIPQIPYSAFGVLVQAVVVKLLAAIKDTTGLQIASSILKKLYEQMNKSLQPRVSGEPIKRTGNGNSLFDCNRRASWRTWW
jgi:hypothetical protein